MQSASLLTRGLLAAPAARWAFAGTPYGATLHRTAAALAARGLSTRSTTGAAAAPRRARDRLALATAAARAGVCHIPPRAVGGVPRALAFTHSRGLAAALSPQVFPRGGGLPTPGDRRALHSSPFIDNLARVDEEDRKSVAKPPPKGTDRPPYHWVDVEAQRLISRAYARHATLGDRSAGRSFPPALDVVDLESLGPGQSGLSATYPATTFTDRLARAFVRGGAAAVHWFFGDRYGHHAVTLETVAAVPGMVAAFHRHFRSLRWMRRDNGHIPVLTEEAENEKFHLLIWLKVTTPTRLERALVVVAQAAYVTFYSAAYALTPKFAHRLTGYLEEIAVQAYTDYLTAIDRGAIPNGPAPDIAKLYYRLPEHATIRDVVLHVRADECMHRDVNHMLADKHANKRGHTRPDFMASDSPQAHAPPAEAFGHSGGAAEGAADKALEQEASGSPADVTDRALLAGTEQPEAKVTQAKH